MIKRHLNENWRNWNPEKENVRDVGEHPITGIEKSGIEDTFLLENEPLTKIAHQVALCQRQQSQLSKRYMSIQDDNPA